MKLCVWFGLWSFCLMSFSAQAQSSLVDRWNKAITDSDNRCVNALGGIDSCVELRHLFATGRVTLMPKGLAQIRKMMPILSKAKKILVVGHTDNVGSEKSNLQLSKRRALSVARYLQKHGVKVIQVIGKGESLPVASNSNHQGRSLNRRIEITMY